MNNTLNNTGLKKLIILASLSLPATASADAAYDSLKTQMDALTQQVSQLKKIIDGYEERSASREEIAILRQEVNSAAEWKNPDTLIHMSGYADVGYVDSEAADGSFNVGTFSPIFHYQYRDLVMLEAELEFEIEPDGGTDVQAEYITIDLFLNDYVTFVGGKFLSPVGQFRQNLHPSWVNKLPSAPPGFGHDGAAPVSDVGFQLRGGFPLGDMRANYAFYVSNGPELESVLEDDEYELEGIEAEGFGADRDGEKVYGGRLALLPVPGLEFGVSFATGDASVTNLIDEETETSMSLSGETARDYDVLGFDFAWQHQSLSIRGEYVETEVGSAATGVTASESSTWETWYTQMAYRLLPTKFEAVTRYTDFDSPHNSEDKEQWALGINYLFSSSVIAKLAYELNDGLNGRESDEDRLLMQLTYGF